MQDHINHVLSKARIAKTHLMRMRPYCNQQQLLALYKTLVWSALEQGSVCYAHATETLHRKLDAFQQSTLRMLRLTPTIYSMTVRRRTAHSAMVYKQSVLQEPPGNTNEFFPVAPPDPRAHLRRTSTTCHPHQLMIPRNSKDLKLYEQFCGPFRTFNSLPTALFPPNPCIGTFKRCVAIFFDSGNQ